jgi:hypothetical protein
VEGAFECVDKLCIAREPGGLIVAYTDDPAQKKAACSEANIAVLAFAQTQEDCDVPGTMVITRRDLALGGAAEVRFGSIRQGQGDMSDIAKVQGSLDQRLHFADLTYAIGSPKRPWNTYRIHSNAARNLPERTRKAQPVKGIPNSVERDAEPDQ